MTTDLSEHVHDRPCAGCPYRQDVPSGVWAEEEYEKLELYDGTVDTQPPIVFACHDSKRDTRGTICRGWLDTHGPYNLLALRLAVARGRLPKEIMNLEQSSVPCFESGEEAWFHGMQDIDDPGEAACELQDKLLDRHSDLKTLED